jgi:4-amino-4-deoxy-L-arabinose transferase-like glycosyltransferase
MRTPSTRTILTVMALAIALAIGWSYRLDVSTRHPASAQFPAMAREMLHGGRYPAEPFYPPGLVWLFLGAFRLFGESRSVETLTQVALSCAEIALGALLAWRLFGRAAAVAAAFVLAVWPYGTAIVLGGGGEVTPALLFILAGLHLLHTAETRGGFHWYALAGLAFGAPGLTRSSLYLLAPALAVGMLAVHWRNRSHRALRVAVLALSGMLLYVPWAARNYMTCGRVLATGMQSRLMGYSLIAAIGESSGRGGAMLFDDDRNYALGLGSPVFLNDYEQVNGIFVRRALQVIRADPWMYLRGCAGRLKVFFGGGDRTHYLAGEDQPIYFEGDSMLPRLVRAAQHLTTITSLWLAVIVALVLLGRTAHRAWGLFLVLLYFVVIHVPIHLEGRYILAVHPMLAIIASAGVGRLWVAVRSGHSMASGPARPR